MWSFSCERNVDCFGDIHGNYLKFPKEVGWPFLSVESGPSVGSTLRALDRSGVGGRRVLGEAQLRWRESCGTAEPTGGGQKRRSRARARTWPFWSSRFGVRLGSTSRDCAVGPQSGCTYGTWRRASLDHTVKKNCVIKNI